MPDFEASRFRDLKLFSFRRKVGWRPFEVAIPVACVACAIHIPTAVALLVATELLFFTCCILKMDEPPGSRPWDVFHEGLSAWLTEEAVSSGKTLPHALLTNHFKVFPVKGFLAVYARHKGVFSSLHPDSALLELRSALDAVKPPSPAQAV